MKKFIFIILALIACACTKDLTNTAFSNAVETKIVINKPVDIYTTELTKAATINTYYAIEIDSLHISNSDTTYVHYAEGIFTDSSNLVVKLEKNRKYRFRATVIEDSQDVVYVNDNYLYNPFTSSSSKKVKITNEFIYDVQGNLELYNNCNTIKVNNGVDKWNAEVNRYYAEYIDKDYHTDSSVVYLNANRRNFGLRFNITPPSDGHIHVYQNYGYPKYDYVVASDGTVLTEDRIFALDLINDYQTIYLKVEWIRGSETIDYSPAAFKAYNGTITSININLIPKTVNNNLGITLNSNFEESQININ